MIANFLLVLGISVSTLAVLDIFMSDAQKQAMSNLVLRWWSWLDDTRKISFLGWLRQDRVRIGLTVVGTATAIAVFWLLSKLLEGLQMDILIVAMAMTFPVNIWAGMKMIRFITGAQTPMHLILRASGCLILTTVPFIAVAWIATEVTQMIYRPTVVEIDSWIPDFRGTFEALAVGALIGAICAISLMFWLLAVVPLFFAYVLSGALGVLEFTMRRIAEYPKGPILAVSALFTATVAILKAFA